jgi:transcriptional regulator with XRE-family HTH domain
VSYGDIGSRLKLAREHAQLTHRALGELADVATSTISELETYARHAPATDLVARLATALGVEPCWLAYGDEDKEPVWLGEEPPELRPRRGRKSGSGSQSSS